MSSYVIVKSDDLVKAAKLRLVWAEEQRQLRIQTAYDEEARLRNQGIIAWIDRHIFKSPPVTGHELRVRYTSKSASTYNRLDWELTTINIIYARVENTCDKLIRLASLSNEVHLSINDALTLGMA